MLASCVVLPCINPCIYPWPANHERSGSETHFRLDCSQTPASAGTSNSPSRGYGTHLSPKHRAAEPLLTRHIFLDTQIYRELGHNPANPALITLKQHIDANRIVLHTTDITMAEVKRQIWERVLTNTRELDVLEKDFRRWRKQASKSMPGETLKFDTEAVAAELFECFEYFITRECRAHLHPALPVDPKIVFAKYFDCKPPFDGTDSKEFPDAFVLEALSAWALSEQDTIHVVTLNRAIGRATSGDPNLWLIASIQDVLARAGAGFAEAEAEAEAVLHNPAFPVADAISASADV